MLCSDSSCGWTGSGRAEDAARRTRQHAARTAHAAEATGADVLAALAAQRAQIRRVQDAHAEVDEQLGQSSSILNRMTRWWRVGL